LLQCLPPQARQLRFAGQERHRPESRDDTIV